MLTYARGYLAFCIALILTNYKILMTHRNPTVLDSPLTPSSATLKPASILFHFQDNAIRTSVDRQGNPWFVAADVCAALGIKNSRDALASLDSDEKGVATTDTLGGDQSFATVNEAGLYRLIFRSRKPEAKDFKRWVTHTVLLTLRKDGLYIQGEENLLLNCDSDGEVEKAFEGAQTLLAELFSKKVHRKTAEHAEEKEARSLALKMMNQGRVRRRAKPQEVLAR
jgi:prophage antirepressor-like protein